jgi:glycosyltransferase involved in cell wall biosynthesis
VRISAAVPSVKKLVCVSQFVKRHTEGLMPARAHGKLVVIENALPHGLETEGGDARLGDVTRIAIIGRLVPEKGQDVVCALARELPTSHFYLVGPYEDSDARYVERIRRCAPDNARFVGYQHPIIDYLKRERIGIVLVPSRIAG